MSVCTRCLEREATPIGELCRACRYYTRGEAGMGVDDPRHGTTAGYRYGCRCDDCRAVWREYQRPYAEAYRRRLGMEPQRFGRTHGIRSTYVRGCRCEECRRAEAEYRRAYRKRTAS